MITKFRCQQCKKEFELETVFKFEVCPECRGNLFPVDYVKPVIMAEIFDKLFAETPPPETPEEVNAFLREAGYDPEQLGKNIRALIDSIKKNHTLERDLIIARQTIADLTAERNAWREDAKTAAAYLLHAPSFIYHEYQEAHRQLHERYATEKSDTDKGE